MKYLLLKDRRRRILVASYEFRRTWLKSLYQHQNFDVEFRQYIYQEIMNLSTNISPAKLRNRCVLTNRPRSIYRKFGLSRLMFRKYASQCKLVGIRKASW
jgi:small subunit ribosomal protein S14